jgi:predicted transposase YdaD
LVNRIRTAELVCFVRCDLMGHNRDILWKGLLEWVFDDLLRFLFPEADQVFDLQAPLSFMDKELARLCPEPGGEHTVRFVDKLVKVELKKKPGGSALFHLEVQGRTKAKDRPFFGERMFHYFNLIFAQYRQPLAAVAIFTGGDGHLLPGGYSYSFMDTRIPYSYKTMNIADYSDEELIASGNPFSYVLLTAKLGWIQGKSREQRWLERKVLIFKKLFEQGLFEQRKLQAILIFMEHYLPFKSKKIIRNFREQVDQITGKKNTMDIFEQVAEWQKQDLREEGRNMGLQEGLLKGQEQSVRNLLSNTKFSVEKIASLVEVPVDFVEKIKAELSAK